MERHLSGLKVKFILKITLNNSLLISPDDTDTDDSSREEEELDEDDDPYKGKKLLAVRQKYRKNTKEITYKLKN